LEGVEGNLEEGGRERGKKESAMRRKNITQSAQRARARLILAGEREEAAAAESQRTHHPEYSHNISLRRESRRERGGEEKRKEWRVLARVKKEAKP